MVHKLAAVLGLSVDNTLALVVKTWGGVADHAPTGDLSDVEDSLIEDWAVWRGVPGEYARGFRIVFVTDGVLDGWRERQGKLVALAEAERTRKSAERARTVRGQSVSTLRNDTTTTTTTARARLREQLTPEGQEALDGLISANTQPEALVGECTMILVGERQIKPKPTPEGLSLALCDLRTNNQRPTARSVRTYTADAMRQLTEGISTSREASGNAWDKVMADAKTRESSNAH
jgi:hypothetical protein